MTEKTNKRDTGLQVSGTLFRTSVPITQDPDYPELIRELADVVERQLVGVGVEPDSAATIAESCAETVREHFGGQQMYWSRGDTMRQRQRRADMWAFFNGANYAEVAKKFGICPQQAYRQVAVAKAEHLARTQGSLFDDQGQPRAGPSA